MSDMTNNTTSPTAGQMRALADDPKLIDVPMRIVRAALRSAADQLDGVRDETADAMRAWDVMRGERDRLRAVIVDAPHADDCCIEDVTWVPGWEGAPTPLRGHCTCWKTDAL